MPLKTAPTRPKIAQAARPLAFAHNLPGRGPLRAAAESTFRVTLDGAARPRSRWFDASTGESATPPVPLTHDPLADLDRLLAAHANPDPAHAFSSGWIGWLSYDLGRWIEPAADGGGVCPPRADAPPLIELHRFTDVRPTDEPRPSGSGLCAINEPRPSGSGPLAALRSSTGRATYVAAVERALEHIRAGDAYQVNLAHVLRGRFTGSTRDLYAALAAAARPEHGAYVESAPGPVQWAVLSLSPELFLSFDPATRRVVTRPMKGTRPAHADPDELMHAPKDRAELAMIVDLMRNDLGRVCEFGSIRVDVPRCIERHATGAAGVLQATATVSGTLRGGVTLGGLLAATFPPGSVTGAPKVRAMRIIDSLEGFRRGPYCGAMAVIDDAGRAVLSVAIRTAVVAGRADAAGRFMDAGFEYAVGAGIVADSDPESEWRETLDKAGPLRSAFRLADV
ncbi:MAG: anthranilate synthase component I family protein [Phycisphaeraceae bacterium]|nr:anthranilate synthase component I family protein [Phycisphaeraceae bacterium]